MDAQSPVWDSATVVTTIVAILTLLIAAMSLWYLYRPKREKLEITFDPEDNNLCSRFGIINLGDASVTVNQVTLSLYRIRRREPMWTNATPIGADGTQQSFPVRIDPGTNIEVHFSTSSGDISYNDLTRLSEQGHGYVFAYTGRGRVFRHKFNPPRV